MRKTVQILGIGQRKSGNAKKTGKPYDFLEISIGYDSPGFSGLRCETIGISSSLIGDRQFVPGDFVDIVSHQYNFKTYIDAIL